MIKLLIMIASVIPFLLICLFGKKVNIKKVHRSRQFLMPIISLLICAVGFYYIDSINQGILDFIYNIPIWLQSVSPDLADSVDRIVRSINWSYWLFFVTNPVMLLGYYIIKRIVLWILSAIFSVDRALHRNLAGLFYNYEQDKNFWSIKNRYGQMRKYFSDFYHGAIIISTLLFLASRQWMEEAKLTAPYYPIFGIIIVGELYFFLDGLTRSEYFKEILGEDEDAQKTVNYSLMRKFLRTVFAKYLAAEDTITHYTSEATISAGNVIENLLVADDPMTVTCAKYYKALNDAGYQLESNYIYSSLDMLHGKSVLFNNPFYWDLIPYIFYPINRTLMRHKKVLIILGRHSIEEDVKKWIHEGVSSVTNIPTLWRVGMLDEEMDPDIGIIPRSDVHNCELHAKRQEFFSKVEFVVIIEPSKLVSTAQIGLNSIIKYCKSSLEDVTFCSCDKNCDGLVDALSHLLMTDISEVSATNKNCGTTSYMCWDYDTSYWQHNLLPNISRYLGIGTELSLAALKNQIQTVQWYGGESYPVLDQLWIDKQYYYEMMQYTGMPTKQEEIQERFRFIPDMWKARVQKNGYITVEDEVNNMFEMIRNFSTRVSEQGFINVISSDYLLKDYMADNASIFMADPKAIPYIVADYARTGRNVIIRILLMFSAGAISEEDIVKELALIGIAPKNVKVALWKQILETYSSLNMDLDEDGILKQELVLYDHALDEHFTFDESVLEVRKHFSIEKNRYENIYSVVDEQFIRLTTMQLKSAAYIAEDEKGNTHYLGTELYGHVFQRHLPGQMFTFDGKYYEMCSVSSDMHVLVRRASDHITGRTAYRQIREYIIENAKLIDDIGTQKCVSGMIISKETADISITTPAYLQFANQSDFFRAKRVEINNIPVRSYHRKQILRIQFADMDEYVRYTVTFLLNEIFGTLFGDNQAYISAVTEIPEFEDDADVNDPYYRPLCYSLTDNSEFAGQGSIYIIEDSQVDLGLMIAFERNLTRIMEMIADYLQWHIEKTASSKNEPEYEEIEDAPEAEPDPPKKKSFFRRLCEKIKKKFRRNKQASEMPEEETGGADVEFEVEEEETVKTRQRARKPYYRRNFLLLGGVSDVPSLKIGETLKYLKNLGLDHNSLKQAREGRDIAKTLEETYNPNKTNTHFCDFCGVELVGTEFETLIDGRERCMNCGRTAVKTAEEFTAIFKDALRNMESFFGIQFNCGIRVEMVNAQKLQRVLNERFVPTSGFDARAVGVAVSDSGGYKILIENGAPRNSAIMTIAHELTHIWQYLNWDRSYIIKKYGKSKRQEVYEGMAVWAEIQYAMLINEKMSAKRMEISSLRRQDEYGRGFRQYYERYPFSEGSFINKPTPFQYKNNPL